MLKRVAIFGEDDERFAGAADQPSQRVKFAFGGRRVPSKLEESLQPPGLFGRVAKTSDPQLASGFIIRVIVDERERQLIVYANRTFDEQRHASLQRPDER